MTTNNKIDFCIEDVLACLEARETVANMSMEETEDRVEEKLLSDAVIRSQQKDSGCFDGF